MSSLATTSAPLTISQTFRPRTWITFIPTPPNHPPRNSSVRTTLISHTSLLNQFPLSARQLPSISSPPISPSQQAPSESTPLLNPCSSESSTKHRRHTVAGLNHSHDLIPGHHRHESHSRHEHHHTDHPRCVFTRFYESADDEGCPSAKISQSEEAGEPQLHYPVSHGHSHHGHGDLEALLERADLDTGTDCTAEEEDADRTIGRKRQIVGILVRRRSPLMNT